MESISVFISIRIGIRIGISIVGKCSITIGRRIGIHGSIKHLIGEAIKIGCRHHGGCFGVIEHLQEHRLCIIVLCIPKRIKRENREIRIGHILHKTLKEVHIGIHSHVHIIKVIVGIPIKVAIHRRIHVLIVIVVITTEIVLRNITLTSKIEFDNCTL